jgi:predicted HAD superfamily Cof-like phosphohydrolase
MTIREIKNWFEQAVPNPTKDVQRIQFACHNEEMAETFDGITSDTAFGQESLKVCKDALNHLSTMMKEKNISIVVEDRATLLDALCDTIVTAVGTAHTYGFDIVGALQEISRSNNSKFVAGKPVFNQQGKIAKGEFYTPPNLTPFLGKDPTE